MRSEIEEYRKEVGLTCDELAYLLGMSRKTLFEIRHGGRLFHQAERQRLKDIMAGKVDKEELAVLPEKTQRRMKLYARHYKQE